MVPWPAPLCHWSDWRSKVGMRRRHTVNDRPLVSGRVLVRGPNKCRCTIIPRGIIVLTLISVQPSPSGPFRFAKHTQTHAVTRTYTQANMQDACELLNGSLFRASFSPRWGAGGLNQAQKEKQEKKGLPSFASASLSSSLSLGVCVCHSATPPSPANLFLPVSLSASQVFPFPSLYLPPADCR